MPGADSIPPPLTRRALVAAVLAGAASGGCALPSQRAEGEVRRVALGFDERVPEVLKANLREARQRCATTSSA